METHGFVHDWPLKLQYQEEVIWWTTKSHEMVEKVEICKWLEIQCILTAQKKEATSEALHKRKIVHWISPSKSAL